jgi:cytoskeletal protein CcmA (bactofilin family)
MFSGNRKAKDHSLEEKIGKLDALIGIDSVLVGDLIAEGTIRIDGRLKGNIKTSGDLFIGEKASVEGNIIANNVFVGGEIRGEAKITGRLELNSTAQLFGSIVVGNLIIENGAIFKGDCTTLQISEEATAPIQD